MARHRPGLRPEPGSTTPIYRVRYGQKLPTQQVFCVALRLHQVMVQSAGEFFYFKDCDDCFLACPETAVSFALLYGCGKRHHRLMQATSAENLGMARAIRW
jgi:hypothetical protein